MGVLALQGDVREHVATLTSLGVTTIAVRTAEQLQSVDALVMPGGESTTISHLLITSGLRDVLAERLVSGFDVLGTCAGMILLASTVLDGRGDQWSFDQLDIEVRRNGYGRQVASFEATLDVAGVGEVTGVFIRAPRVESVGPDVQVLATLDHGDGGHPVLVRQGRAWGCCFHPELANDARIHELFVDSL